MSKIVYLIGAGASVGTLPLVKEMPKWIDVLIKELSSNEMSLSNREFFEKPNNIQGKSKQEYQNELIVDLMWLKDSAASHISIDTYAKKLSIKRDFDKLKKLKILLSVYFTLEQIRHRPNKRYDFFFASIMESLYKFPEDIRILSWNYDSQLEIAFSEFSDQHDIYTNRKLLNVHIKNKRIEQSELDTFGIYKLNGSTELSSLVPEDKNIYFFNLDISPSLKKSQLETITRMYATAISKEVLISNLSFAWEPSNYENFMDNVKEDTGDAEILVVIGYSFPYFNRSVDREIILNMKNLKKVHFQSPDADNLMVRFKSIRTEEGGLEFLPEEDTMYFFIPDELSK